MRVLLVEDDESIASALEKILAEQHYVVDVATDGQVGWEFVEAFTYDLILLDVILPKLNGIEFCQQLRAQACQTPILLLTAQSSSSDRVVGLDAGADDYVVKPFEPQELLARIRVLLRRQGLSRPTVLEWLKLRLDPGICEVTYTDQLLHLTPKEYRLLELFLRNPHRVFSRSAILDHLWSCEEPPGEYTVTVHIKTLRHKLKQVGAPTDFIETVYGQGYRLKQNVASTQESANIPTWVQESLLQQRTKDRLADVWEKHRGLSSDRCAILEQASAAWLTDQLTEELRQKARHAAHRLTGALGIFGFSEGSRLTGEIDCLLQVSSCSDQDKAHQCFERVTALRRVLQQNRPTDGGASPLVLVIDDDSALTEQIQKAAIAWGLVVELALNMAEVCQTLQAAGRRAAPQTHGKASALQPHWLGADVILLNCSLMTLSDADLVDLAALTHQMPSILVLFLTDRDSLSIRVKVGRVGAHAFVSKSHLPWLASSGQPNGAKPSLPNQILEMVAQLRSHLRDTAAKVMVVDDDPQILAGIRALLEPWGVQLVTLTEPRQFWQTLSEVSPDLLLLDIKMPDFSGIELCQVVRNTPQWETLPVLFLTAYSDPNTVHQALTVGADDCISKTVDSSELVTRVFNHLERSRLFHSMAAISSR